MKKRLNLFYLVLFFLPGQGVQGSDLDVDLLKHESVAGVVLENFGPPRMRRNESIRPLRAQNASATVTLNEAYPILIKVRLISQFEDQRCSIAANGGFLLLEHHGDKFLVNAKAGPNKISFFCRVEGNASDLFNLYGKKFGRLAYLNPFRMKTFYYEYRNEPAYFTELSVKKFTR